MNFFTLLFLAFILTVVPISSSAASYPSPEATTLGEVRISLLEGDVQLKPEDADDWVPASINMPLRSGDRLWVPERGRAELQLRYDTYVRLDEGTSLEILRMESDSVQFYTSEGHVYVNVRQQRYRVLQFDTPVSSVRAYDRAAFRLDVNGGGYTHISVLKGAVNADSRSGRTRIEAGKTLSLRDDLYSELSPLLPADAWERWNRERDERLVERRYSSRYLPDELSYYSYDFDEYGKWVYTRDYGYCWTPTLSVSVGWSPYRTGRWIWRGGDYVWISYEPWGWVPYHYGRWSFIASIGWCWVPPMRGDVFWGPGYVGWVYTPEYVSWVPLAPGELYYGYGHFGRYSMNIVNVNINTVVVNRSFRNASVRDGVIIVGHDTFLTGRPAPVRTRENPFFTEKISVGRPAIRPERSTFFPIVREVPRANQPPKVVRDLKVEELTKSRPLVKDRAVPVFRETPQRTMPMRVYKEPRGTESRTFIEKGSVPYRGKGAVPAERPQKGTQVPQSGQQQRQTIERPAERPVQPIDKTQRQGIERPQGRQPLPAEKIQKQEKELPGGKQVAPAGQPQRQTIERPAQKPPERSGPPIERQQRLERPAPPAQSPPPHPQGIQKEGGAGEKDPTRILKEGRGKEEGERPNR